MLLIKKDSIFSFLLDYITQAQCEILLKLSTTYVLNANTFPQSLLKIFLRKKIIEVHTLDVTHCFLQLLLLFFFYG